AVEEAVLIVTGVKVHPDDLARVVDAACIRAAGAQRIVEGGEGAPAVEEAFPLDIRIGVRTDDLARIADAERNGGHAQGIVEGGEGIDWHDTGSSPAHLPGSNFS